VEPDDATRGLIRLGFVVVAVRALGCPSAACVFAAALGVTAVAAIRGNGVK
jgi:hypothetical protein